MRRRGERSVPALLLAEPWRRLADTGDDRGLRTHFSPALPRCGYCGRRDGRCGAGSGGFRIGTAAGAEEDEESQQGEDGA